MYGGLDPDAEILLRSSRHKARRQEKKESDKGRRRRNEQRERMFTARAQEARAPAPRTRHRTADGAFVTLAIGRAEGRQAELDCKVDPEAQVSSGNMRHMLNLALQYSQAVRAVIESGGPPGAHKGIATPFATDGAKGTPLPVTIEWRTTYVQSRQIPSQPGDQVWS